MKVRQTVITAASIIAVLPDVLRHCPEKAKREKTDKADTESVKDAYESSNRYTERHKNSLGSYL